MTCQYPDLGSASVWLKREGISFQPIRSTFKVAYHQYGISALVTQMSFCEGSSGDLARCQLFSQATLHGVDGFFQPCSQMHLVIVVTFCNFLLNMRKHLENLAFYAFAGTWEQTLF